MKLDEILETGRTIRKFEQKEVPDEVIARVLKNVRTAHCGNNRQVLRYIVVKSEEKRREVGNIVHFAASLPREIGEPKEDEKAMLYIAITKPAGNTPIQDIDCGIAAEVICETAWDEGVGSCMMLNFNVQAANEIMNVSEDRTVRMIIAMGYPKHRSTIVDVPESGNVSYYVDDQIDYYVPKRSVEELSEII